jgi:hypothetical protein
LFRVSRLFATQWGIWAFPNWLGECVEPFGGYTFASGPSPMKYFQSAAFGLSLLALSAGGAFAQNTMMKQDDMAKPMHMSKHDMKTMKKCQAMSHDKMMKKSSCMKMMKMHSDMMKDGSMMSQH